MKAVDLVNSIALRGTVAIGTSVMIGAGIFGLSSQIAELARPLFQLSFIAGAIATAFSAYTHFKRSNAYPLLFVALLLVSGAVVCAVPAIASGLANAQQVAAVTAHPVPCCDQPGQKTHHSGSGMHIACAFCAPTPHSFEQAVPRATGPDIFQRDFVMTLSRNAAPDPFPPKIISTA